MYCHIRKSAVTRQVARNLLGSPQDRKGTPYYFCLLSISALSAGLLGRCIGSQGAGIFTPTCIIVSSPSANASAAPPEEWQARI
jgi:hypothetical protein